MLTLKIFLQKNLQKAEHKNYGLKKSKVFLYMVMKMRKTSKKTQWPWGSSSHLRRQNLFYFDKRTTLKK